MATITLGDFITLVFQELAQTCEQTAALGKRVNLHVSDVALDIPAHVRLQAEQPASATVDAKDVRRVLVALPSTLENPPLGRVGRIHLQIGANVPTPADNRP